MTAGVPEGTGLEAPDGQSGFEQRARALLLASAENLPGAVRSQLTQARHAALAAHQRHLRRRLWRWAPAGAAVAAALAVLVVYVPHARHAPVNLLGNGGLEDIDLLASDVPLSADQDVDYSFYEWAVDAASDGAAAAATGSGDTSRPGGT